MKKDLTGVAPTANQMWTCRFGYSRRLSAKAFGGGPARRWLVEKSYGMGQLASASPICSWARYSVPAANA